MGKNIKLKADLSTLRLSHLHASSAFALADVYSEESTPLSYAPRTMLRKQIEASAGLKPSIGMQFSVNYQNNKKEKGHKWRQCVHQKSATEKQKEEWCTMENQLKIG